MKVLLSQKYFDIDDEVMKQPQKDGETKEIQLFDVLKVACTAELQEDSAGADAVDKKMKNFDLYLSLREVGRDGEIELSSEQVTHLKPRIAKIYSTLIAAPTIRMLEGKSPYGSVSDSAKT